MKLDEITGGGGGGGAKRTELEGTPVVVGGQAG